MKLTGKKVILRPIELRDARRFVDWMNDPEITRLARGNANKLTLAGEKEWIRSIPKLRGQKHFSIDTHDGVHIGGIGFKTINKLSSNGEIGITIGDKRYWGKGYGTDAMRSLIDYGFKKLGLHRIYVYVFAYNKRSIAMNKKLGFRKEGVLRDGASYKGKFHDELVMGLLKSEWKR